MYRSSKLIKFLEVGGKIFLNHLKNSNEHYQIKILSLFGNIKVGLNVLASSKFILA